MTPENTSLSRDRPASIVDQLAATADALQQWTLAGRAVYWAVVGLFGGVWTLAAAAWLYQVYFGLDVTGLNHPVMWATYIASFVFWIGIAHSGTLVSAVLFLFRAPWRTSIARLSETMTLAAIVTAMLFPVIHLGRPWRFYWLIPYPNERGLWINFSSPLIWDAAAVGTYFIASTIFWFVHLVPDFAVLRDRPNQGALQHRVLTWAAIGWRGTVQQWVVLRRIYAVLAAVITILVVSVHSIVSWDFAAAIVPGWHSTLFAPYFVAGAMFSGLAMIVILVLPARELLGLHDAITARHLDNLGKLILTLSLVLTYSYVIEATSALSDGTPYERAQMVFRFGGSFAPLFWITIACNSVVPLVLFSGRFRRQPTAILLVAIAVTAGMWLERFVIIAASLAHEFNSYSWGGYRPTYIEMIILIGSLAWFLFWFLLIIGHIPPLPISEAHEEAS